MMLVSLFCPMSNKIFGCVFIDWFQGHCNNLDFCYGSSSPREAVGPSGCHVCTSWVHPLHSPLHTWFGQVDAKVCRTAKKAWLTESYHKCAMTRAGFLMIKHVSLPHWKAFHYSSQLSKTVWKFQSLHCPVQSKQHVPHHHFSLGVLDSSQVSERGHLGIGAPVGNIWIL